ncbi:MAG: 50S ribosomal protein L32 [Polyangiaceae bacterium]|nr:50S ribosomal protein L32 [Polyangiaceae bacterium]
MAVPKRKTSSSKRDMRRQQHDKVGVVSVATCEKCGEPTLPHRICPACGNYKGRRLRAGKTAG